MSRTLAYGDRGSDVADVQSALNVRHPEFPLLDVDGIFGSNTQARVISFQKGNGLSRDGIVGPKTSAALFPGDALDIVRAMRLRAAALTVECFKTRVEASFQCVRDGPPVTPYDFVLCRYLQSLLVDSNGLVDSTSAQRQRAEGQVNRLRFFLDRMLLEFADRGDILSELLDKWGPELRSFDGRSLDVSGFVSKQLQECYQRAQRQVEYERRSKNTVLGQMGP